jgi:hypothetical protein
MYIKGITINKAITDEKTAKNVSKWKKPALSQDAATLCICITPSLSANLDIVTSVRTYRSNA